VEGRAWGMGGSGWWRVGPWGWEGGCWWRVGPGCCSKYLMNKLIKKILLKL